MLEVTGRLPLLDDDKACTVRTMPATYALSVPQGRAKRVSSLACAIARDQAHLDGLDTTAPTSRLQGRPETFITGRYWA